MKMEQGKLDKLFKDAVDLLKGLISTPSFSREEDKTALCIEEYFHAREMQTRRLGNNVWIRNKFFESSRPTILLNSHHDTVKPNKTYTLDPFQPIEKDGKLYGLGSNDAGGALVSLIATFTHFFDREVLPFNLILAATAEEEISGSNGIESLLPELGQIDCGIVGEPTLMEMAVAERGLMVLDCVSKGRAGHAARREGENAIYKAMMDIEWIYTYKFKRISELLGPVSLSVTSIETENKAHNIVPAECKFVVDARVNELYSFDEILEILRASMQSEISPRSMRLRSTSIDLNHPLVRAGASLGSISYGSPTTSDKALMHFPTLKMGPGDSARSHTADEYIYVEEIRKGIDMYIALLEKIKTEGLRNFKV